MGRKVSDGKAFDAAAPSGQVINDYDLYRIGGWNGVAIGAKDATQTDRTLAFECDPAAIYSIKVPSGLTVAAGDRLYWTTEDGSTFQRGDTHLQVAADANAGQSPCFIAMTAKNANNEVQGRVLQSQSQTVGDVVPQASTDLTDASGGAVTGGLIAIRSDTLAHAAADAAANDATLAAAFNALNETLEAAGVLT